MHRIRENKMSAFFQKNSAPHLSSGCMWYCKSALEPRCITKHNRGAVLREYVFLILYNPLRYLVGGQPNLTCLSMGI